MAVDARGGEKEPAPGCRPWVFRRGLPLGRHPTGELFRGIRDNTNEHLRVLRPAIFGAVAAVYASLLWLDPHPVDAVRDQIGLPREFRGPETMYDVRRFEGQESELALARFADRRVQLIRRNDAQVRIVNLPPPLMPDDRRFQRVRRLGIILHVGYRARCDEDEHD